MKGEHCRLVLPGAQARQGAFGALAGVDGFGLRAAFVHREHDAAVQQLFVDLDGGGGQEDHHRAFDPVLLGDEVAGHGVFAGAGYRQLALGLQELQGVAGARGAFFFGNGQDLVLELGLAHVEQALPGHGAVLDAFFLGHEGQHGVHQAALAGGRAGLHHHGQGGGELAADGCQVAHELVAGFAHQTHSVEVGQDAREQVGGAQPGLGLRLLGIAHHRGGRLDLERGHHALGLQGFQLQQHAAQVVFDDFFTHGQLARGLHDVGAARTRRVQVEGIDVIDLGGRVVTVLAADQHIDLQCLVREVLGQAPDAVAALAKVQEDFIVANVFDGWLTGRLGTCSNAHGSS